MRIPIPDTAEKFLLQAETMNPGPWVQHSRNAALAARLIAERHPQMDPDAAFVLGLLHDIGRREGVYHLRHVVDGYHFLMEQGYPDAARICLTHSFPINDIRAYFGENDCSRGDYDLLLGFLERVEYTPYDHLIQLCDAISMPSGFCLMEKRLVDVALRYGATEVLQEVWQARFRHKEEIEQTIGCSIYSLLPGVVENTFGG